MGTTRRIGISYARFSNLKQGAGDSENRQDEDYRSFCDRHNLTPVKTDYVDRGRSGYHDAHRKKGKLGVLVARAKEGQFEAGTVIVIEAWDRLGRLRPDKQTELVAELLRTGVDIGICRMDDIFTENDFGTHKWTTLAVFVQMAYQESKQKADRVARSWKTRRSLYREKGVYVTGKVPAWILTEEKEDGSKVPVLVDGKMVGHPDRVATLQLIFSLSAQGHGLTRIIRHLTANNITPFASEKWCRPYLANILSDRRVLGEFQLHLVNGTADGEVIKDYYPAVISEEEWLLASAGLHDRRTPQSTRDRQYVNVFQSLLIHARDGEGFALRNWATKANPKLSLMNLAGVSGRKDRTVTIQYPIFEEAILGCLAEVKAADVLPKKGEGPSRVDVLRLQLKAVREQVAALKEDLRTDGYSKSLAALLREQEDEEERVAAELQEELARSVKTTEQAWVELPGLVQLVKTGGDEVRLKLRTVLRRTVEKVWLLTISRRARRLVVAQVRFVGGGQREYLLDYYPSCNGRKAWWRVASIRSPFGTACFAADSAATIGLAPFDLSTPAGVEATEEMLSVDDDSLEEYFEGAERHTL